VTADDLYKLADDMEDVARSAEDARDLYDALLVFASKVRAAGNNLMQEDFDSWMTNETM
jgi:hypothetical protein